MIRRMRYATTLVVGVFVASGIATVLAAPASNPVAGRAEERAKPAGLSAARAVFLQDGLVVSVPLDAATWGSAVKLDETSETAFGIIVPRKPSRFGENEWVVSAHISSAEEIANKNKDFFFELYRKPPTPYGLFPSPETMAFQEVLRRCTHPTLNWDVSNEGQTLLISDNGEIFNDVIALKPKSIKVFVHLVGAGLQECEVKVEYRFDPAKAQPTPIFE